MPQREDFWNPYRWVQVSDESIQRKSPTYRHRLDGLSGRIHCRLQTLTPLIIASGQQQGSSKTKTFIRSELTGKPFFLPATSLKGTIRSLAELVGNAAVPFSGSEADRAHGFDEAAAESGANWQLDIVARTFGYLDEKRVFAGLIRFSDGQLVGDSVPKPLKAAKVAVGQPKPAHDAFYPDKRRRKFYHHRFGAESLTPPHAGITQTNEVCALPADTQFHFHVDFGNLRDEELNLLLYCLVLEEDVTVTLSKDALAPNATGSATFTGPLRHKLGGCKPQGGGSVHIRVTRLELRTDPAARYRGADSLTVFENETLDSELLRRTEAIRNRADSTMQQLRAMLVYSSDDPRTNINYPTYTWFLQEKNQSTKTPLKPLL